MFIVFLPLLKDERRILHALLIFISIFSEIEESHSVAKVSLEFVNLLPQSPKCWDYRHVLSYPLEGDLTLAKEKWEINSNQPTLKFFFVFVF